MTDQTDLLADAVAHANIPTLLMVLVQLTGDERWLGERYRVQRAGGMGDNDTGGLDPAAQQEIRSAALDAIRAWQGGQPVALPQPAQELLVRMLSHAMGEPIPEEYGEFTAAQLRHDPTVAEPITGHHDLNALIVGAGASGLCAAVHFKQAGIPFEVVEKSAGVGGVWRQNTYPGAGVDTPNHLYSFSFMAYDWPLYFALQSDLNTYLEHVADNFGLREHIRFETEVVRAEWDDDNAEWRVTLTTPDDGTIVRTAKLLLSATGIFNPPVWPDINGVRDFKGPVFHSAEVAGRR